MARLIGWIALALAFAEGPAFAQGSVGNLFRDYKALSTPQSAVPIGAIWVPDVGPSGNPAPPANLSVAQGATSAVVTQAMKRQIGFSLGTFLGLSANKSRNLRVELGNIQIHRVRDLTKLDARVGQQVILSAIKAGSISIDTDQEAAGQIRANAQARNIPVEVRAAGNNGNRVELDGSDLFLAFQVVEFRRGNVREATRRHRGREITFDNTYQFDFCQCGPGNLVKIYVRNLQAPDVSGNFPLQTFEIQQGSNRWVEVPLNRYMRGNLLTAASAKIGFNGRVCSTNVLEDGQPLCVASFPADDNYVRLRTTTTQIVPVRNPQGAL